MNLIPRRKRERKRWYPFSQTRVAKVAAASGLRSFLLSLSLSDFLVSIQSLSLSLSLSLSSVLLSLSSVLLSRSLSLSLSRFLCYYSSLLLSFFSRPLVPSSRESQDFLEGRSRWGKLHCTSRKHPRKFRFLFERKRENLKKQGDVISISTHFVHVIPSIFFVFCFLFFGFPCESCPSL